jgi:hypothetical protein
MKDKNKQPAIGTPANTPIVKSTTGLGTGGAGVDTKDADVFGFVNVSFGVGYLAAGNVVLHFPVTPPPAMFVSGDDAFGSPITHSVAGNDLTIAWTAAHVGTPSPLQFYRLHYEQL